MVILRKTLPLRIHQLWDCLEHSTPNSPLDFDAIAKVGLSLHNISKDELLSDLNSAVDDGLIKRDENKAKGQPTYSLPDQNFENRGDHDWYCFHCHVGGEVVACEDCTRVYHMDCLADDRKPQQDLFICPACHIKSSKPSLEKLSLKQKPLNTLLTYICGRITEWGIDFIKKFDGKIWATTTRRAAKESWRLNYLVYIPMDMGIISDKAETGKYTTLEEFQVDCETLYHAIGCYFGPDACKSGVGASLMKDILHDINEIQLCHDCFRRSNEKDHPWWFCFPCHKPHDVVWAKQPGYPYWPAKVMKKDGSKYDVRYFGANYERAMIDAKAIFPIDTPLTKLKVRKTASWNEAYEELQQFLKIKEDPSLVENMPNRTRTSGKSKGTAESRNIGESGGPSTPKRRKITNSTKSVESKSVPSKQPRSNSGGALQKPASTLPKQGKIAAGMQSGSGEAAAGHDPFPLKPSRVMLDLFEEFEHELRLSNTKDCSEGKVTGSSDDSSEKGATENVVSSTEPSTDSLSPPTKKDDKGAFGENVNNVLEKYKQLVNERFASELSATKRKQWCFNCEREAIYHCCWNTAYCSTACQQFHWTKEHKRLCRRVKRDRQGYALENQPQSDDC